MYDGFDWGEGSSEMINEGSITDGELTRVHVITVSFGDVSAQQAGSQSMSVQILLDRAVE